MSTINENSHLKNFLLGATSGVCANVGGAIPLSRVTARAAVDIPMHQTISSHYRAIWQELVKERAIKKVYIGGGFRVMQKIFAPGVNALVPEKLKQKHPLLCGVGVGAISSIPANFFKLLQTYIVTAEKTEKKSYQQLARKLLFTREGRIDYIKNTRVFMFNESLRCAMLFGVSDLLRKKLGIDNTTSIVKKIAICGASAIGSAILESTISTPLEIFVLVDGWRVGQGKTAAEPGFRNILKFFKEHNMLNRKYILRCGNTILMKNFWANYILILFDQTRRDLAKN